MDSDHFSGCSGIRIWFTRYAYASLALTYIATVLHITGDILAQMDLRIAAGLLPFSLQASMRLRSRWRTRTNISERLQFIAHRGRSIQPQAGHR